MILTWLRIRRAREAATLAVTASAPVANAAANPPYSPPAATAVNPAYAGSSYPQATAVPYPAYGGASSYTQQGAAEAYPGSKGSYPDPYPAYPAAGSGYPQVEASPYPGSAPSYSGAGGAFRADGTMAGTGAQGGRNQAVLH